MKRPVTKWHLKDEAGGFEEEEKMNEILLARCVQTSIAILVWFSLTLPSWAETFSAVHRVWDGPNRSGMGSFRSDNTLTVSLIDGNPEAILLIPREVVDIIMRYQPWPPNVSVLLNGGGASGGSCIENECALHGNKAGDCFDWPLRILPGGDGEIRVSADWFRDAVSYPYEFWKRWETCVNTNGETDTFRPGSRCPSDIGLIGVRLKSCSTGETFHKRHSIARPQSGWLITLAVESESSFVEAKRTEFIFLGDSEDTHFLAGSSNPPEWRPKLSQFGELEKLYAWYESPDEPREEAQPELSSISWVTGDPVGILDALEQLTEKLEPHVEGRGQQSYLYLIRRLIDGLRLQLESPAAASR